MLVLGIDPSVGKDLITGAALLEVGPPELPEKRARLLKDVALRRPEEMSEVDYALHSYLTIRGTLLTKGLHPDHIFIEWPVYGSNARSLIAQSTYIGGLAVLFYRHYGEVNEINPSHVKAYLGVPWKDRKKKSLVVHKIREILGNDTFLEEETKPVREAICDAVAIACAGSLLYS
jgi:Holliday junction resolvasome RuvABC endonuclease subunit